MISKEVGGLTRRDFLRQSVTLASGVAAGLNPFSGLEAKANSLFVELNDDNYKKEILDYEGPALVLFYDGNFARAPPSGRMYKIFEELAKAHTNRPLDRFNGNGIKFGTYDIASVEDIPSTREDKYKKIKYRALDFPTTIIYLTGKEIDKLRSGPTDDKFIDNWIKFLGEQWVTTNITKPNGEFYWRFNDTWNAKKVFYNTNQQ